MGRRAVRGKLLKQSTLEQMWTATTRNDGKPVTYGLGWMVGENNGHRFFSHSGSHSTGFQSHFTRYRDEHLTIIVLTNLVGSIPGTLVKRIAHF